MQYVYFNQKLMVMNLVQAATGLVQFRPLKSQDEADRLILRFRTEDGFDFFAEFTLLPNGAPANVWVERVDDGIRRSGEDVTMQLEDRIKDEIRKYNS